METPHQNNIEKQLFTQAVKQFFSKGIDDSELALLKIKPYEAAYWTNSTEEGLLRFIGILGASPAADEKLHHGEHSKIHL